MFRASIILTNNFCPLNAALYARSRVMANENIRKLLLDFLADKYELKGGQHVAINEFLEIRGLTKNDIISTLDHFVASKLIQLSLDNKLAALTPKGYDITKPHDVSVKKTGHVNVSVNAPIIGSVVAFGNSSASISHSNIDSSVNPNQLEVHFDELRKEINSLRLDEAERISKQEVVDKIELLVKSESPDKTLINMLFTNALPLTTNIASLAVAISTLMP